MDFKLLLSQLGDGNIIALDIGDKKIGVARAHSVAKIPEPLDVINNDKDFLTNFSTILCQYDTILVVVGLPRGMNGQETDQTKKIREFVAKIDKDLAQPIVFEEETLTSVMADNFLSQNKKSKASQDSIAACYILAGYLEKC